MSVMWTDEDIRKVSEEIMAKAMTDRSFRERALKNGTVAVEEIAGKELPAGISVAFVDNDLASHTFVLPDIVQEDQELTEAELEQVAGGRGGCGGSKACVGGTNISLGVCVNDCAATCAGASCAGTTLSIGIGIPTVGCVAGI